MLLAHATWPQLPVAPTVLVPVGSTEQHGPHLPFDTDSIIATAVSSGVAEALGAIVAPTITYGASGEHQDFPGTASIGSEALRLLILELVRSISTWAGRIVLVNAHGGNVGTLGSVVPQLIAERHKVAWVTCTAQGGDAHAGRTETSMLLHLSPNIVRVDLAMRGNTAPIGELIGELSRSGVRSVSPTGVLGDPSGATAVEGEAQLELLVANISELILVGAVDKRGCLR